MSPMRMALAGLMRNMASDKALLLRVQNINDMPILQAQMIYVQKDMHTDIADQPLTEMCPSPKSGSQL